MRIESVGHALFAATLIALGVMGLVTGDFTPIWQSAPKTLPGREALAYVCAVVALAGGAGLLLRRAQAAASLVLFAFLLLWMLAFKVPIIVRHPGVEGAYQSCGENTVIVAAAWVLCAWFNSGSRALGLITGDVSVRLAQGLCSLGLIAFGFSHFVYLDLTTPLVPSWLGAPTAWAWFTGGAYLAAGVAMLTGVFARLGATLAALQIGLITLLVWTPIVAAGHVSAMHTQETILSGVLTAAAWVMAESYRGAPWLSFRLSSQAGSSAIEPSRT